MTEPVEKIQLVPNREELALELLPSQYHGKVNVEGLIKMFSDEVQLVENTLIDLLTLRTLNKASGEQLDEIGRRLNLSRTSQNDEIFRTAIRVKALSKRNEGTEEDVARLLQLISGDPNVSLYKFEPYGVTATYNTACVPEDRIEQISAIFPVVTDLYLEEFITARGFGFSSITDPNPDLNTVNYGPFSSIGSQPDPLTQGTFVSLAYSTTT
jgi:hypothetical protein